MPLARGSSALPSVLLCIGLQELAKYPNVYCKASRMFATDPKWDQASVDMVVKPQFEYFGCDRLVCYIVIVVFCCLFCTKAYQLVLSFWNNGNPMNYSAGIY